MSAPPALPSPRASPTQRPLRIVIPALCYFPEHKDGSSRLAYDEAKYLAEMGHEVWLVAMATTASAPEYAVDGNLHVLRYRRPRWSACDPTGPHQRAVRRVLRRHVAGPVDVVHAHTLLAGSAAYELYGTPARTCYTVHSPVQEELLAACRGAPVMEQARLRLAAAARSRLEGRLLRLSGLLTCDSSLTRHLVGRIHGAGVAARLEVVPGWVDLERFRVLSDRVAAKRALGWPLDRPVLFCLRRFVPRNGLDVLLQAVASLKALGRVFRLILAGDGTLRRRLEAKASALGLLDTVTFPGVVPEDQLPMMYGAADALVLPSKELECFGLVAIEALACGRPVLATPVAAIPEVIGGVEPAWLAADSSLPHLIALIGDFLDGKLPIHTPAHLRAFVAGRYSSHIRLAELARLVIGEPDAVYVGGP